MTSVRLRPDLPTDRRRSRFRDRNAAVAPPFCPPSSRIIEFIGDLRPIASHAYVPRIRLTLRNASPSANLFTTFSITVSLHFHCKFFFRARLVPTVDYSATKIYFPGNRPRPCCFSSQFYNFTISLLCNPVILLPDNFAISKFGDFGIC